MCFVFLFLSVMCFSRVLLTHVLFCPTGLPGTGTFILTLFYQHIIFFYQLSVMPVPNGNSINTGRSDEDSEPLIENDAGVFVHVLLC